MRQRAMRLAFVAVVLGAAPLAGVLGSGGAGQALADPVQHHAQTIGFDRFPRHLAASMQRASTRTLAARQTAKRSSRARARQSVVFRWPAEGTITTPFIPSGPLEHDGIDIGDLRSLTVIAAHGGEVIHVGYTTGFEGYGNIVDVVIAPGVETLYAHLSAMNVQVGDHVTEGETIATAGCTGRCSGTHLHFEVRENGTPVDPMQFLH